MPVLTTSSRIISAAVCLVTAWILSCGTGHAAQADRIMEYLYVEANEGDSSGGHTAIRFDRQTFHFQHETPSIIRIRRLDSAAFNHMYARLGNRTIRESMIAVSGETYTLLLDTLTRLFLVQDAQLALRDELRRDISFFEQLLQWNQAADRTMAKVSIPVKGLGYFTDFSTPGEYSPNAGEACGDTASGTLCSLHKKILAVYGDSFIADRIVRTRMQIKDLALQATNQQVTNLTRTDFPGYYPNASTRYYDALSALSALEALQAAPPIRQGAYRTSENNVFKLEPQEALVLKRFAAQQEDHLVSLVNSSRPDWGEPFMTGTARLAAAYASLQSGRLTFVDIFPAAENGQRADHVTGAEQREQIQSRYLPAMNNERREAFLHWRREFFKSGSFREADYAAMEHAGNLLADIEQAIATGTLPRNIPDDSFPSRTGQRTELPLPDMDGVVLQRELAAARAVAADYDAALARLYSYNLVRRNCVTEIFAVINSTMEQRAADDTQATGTPQANTVSESTKRLGGFIEASDGLTFVPFVSADKVNASYDVVVDRELPSYRRERLKEMAQHESPLLVFLRESNTITSTIYRPTPNDSTFLFFTDNTFMLRPLFGVFNLLVGFGDSLLGVAVMPFKGTDHLLSGVRGMLFSLPELAFVNLRKGSMAYVERAKD